MDNRLAEYLKRRYAAIATRVIEDDGQVYYVAFHPELDGCVTTGNNMDEALANLEDARRLYLQSLIEDGITPPEPEHLRVIADKAHLICDMNLLASQQRKCSSRSEQEDTAATCTLEEVPLPA